MSLLQEKGMDFGNIQGRISHTIPAAERTEGTNQTYFYKLHLFEKLYAIINSN